MDDAEQENSLGLTDRLRAAVSVSKQEPDSERMSFRMRLERCHTTFVRLDARHLQCAFVVACIYLLYTLLF